MRDGTQEYLESDGAWIEDRHILLGHESIAMSLHYAGQAAATARRGSPQYSPVAKLGLHLGKRLQRGRPEKGALSCASQPRTLKLWCDNDPSARHGLSVRRGTRLGLTRLLRFEHLGKIC